MMQQDDTNDDSMLDDDLDEEALGDEVDEGGAPSAGPMEDDEEEL